MTEFPHLELSYSADGLKKRPGFGPKWNSRTTDNLKNRGPHAERLRESIERITTTADGAKTLSLFLQIDPHMVAVEHLRRFNIEVVAELEDGFILGSSADTDLLTLTAKISRFLQDHQDNVGGLWSIDDGKRWKLEHILSPYLKEHWPYIIQRDRITVDLGIACLDTWAVPDKPRQRPGEDEENYQRRVGRWSVKRQQVFDKWEGLSSRMARRFYTLGRWGQNMSLRAAIAMRSPIGPRSIKSCRVWATCSWWAMMASPRRFT